MRRYSAPCAILVLAAIASGCAAPTSEKAGHAAVSPRMITPVAHIATTAPARAPEAPSEPAAVPPEELECLAKALYFEARGEPRKGRRAVAEVILNRVDRDEFPDTICDVVHDTHTGCQFSWTCTGEDTTPRNLKVYRTTLVLAERMIENDERPLTGGATHFHNSQVSPAWAGRLDKTVTIGGHHFYRLP